jgi:hypothetical protein
VLGCCGPMFKTVSGLSNKVSLFVVISICFIVIKNFAAVAAAKLS